MANAIIHIFDGIRYDSMALNTDLAENNARLLTNDIPASCYLEEPLPENSQTLLKNKTVMGNQTCPFFKLQGTFPNCWTHLDISVLQQAASDSTPNKVSIKGFDIFISKQQTIRQNGTKVMLLFYMYRCR